MDERNGPRPSGIRRVMAKASNPFGPLSDPAYRTVWIAASLIAFGTWAERIAVGWLVLVETNSVLLSAATFGIRSAPSLIAAPIGGAVSDRFPRNRVLRVTALMRATAILAMALVAIDGVSSPWPIFLLVAIGGVVNSFEMPAMQGLITDIVPRTARMNAISINSLGTRAVGAVGAFAAGAIAEIWGVPYALFAAMASILVGGLVLLFVPTMRTVLVRAREPVSRIFRDAAMGIRSMVGMPTVSTLLWMAVVVEIFGFAYEAVMPAMARDELHVTESGLGTLRFATGVGAVGGTIVLSLLGEFRRKGPLLLGIAFGYGLGLLGLSISPSFAMAIVLVTMVGAMAAMFDAMEWTLLQANVPDNMRGRVIGGWVFAIGFGWLGHMAMGAVGEAVGVRWAIGGAGLVVITASLAAVAFAPILRRA